MGQKANLLTVQTGFRGLPSGNALQKIISTRLLFLKFLELLFRGRRVYVVDANFFRQTGVSFVQLTLFFRAAKLLELKKHLRGSMAFVKRRRLAGKRLLPVTKAIATLFFKRFLSQLFYFKSTFSGVFRVQVINKGLFTSAVAQTYIKSLRLVKKVSGVLFLRRYLLLVDVAKLLTLLVHKRVSFVFFIRLLGEIFRGLQKKRHSRFLFFLKELFAFLIGGCGVRPFRGIKFRVNGRLSGKPRSGTSCLILGSVPASTLSAKTVFAKTHVYTVYGAFGFRIWVTLN